MHPSTLAFDEQDTLHQLRHYLPAQAPLKDFVHHNTLHAYQHMAFDKAIYHASSIFGYRVSLSLAEYRAQHQTGRITDVILEKVIAARKGLLAVPVWRHKMLTGKYKRNQPRIGSLRSNWKKKYQVDLDSMVHPLLFRILCSFMDQGISIWNFPVRHKSFLASLRELERISFTSFFKGSRAKNLLLHSHCEIKKLLQLLVGADESLYVHYLFDQQFSHQGWSGMVATVEREPETLLDRKKITLHDLIVFELLLEIDALDDSRGEKWLPLDQVVEERPVPLFSDVPVTELDEITTLWQEAYEWSYYDEVLAGLSSSVGKDDTPAKKSFQSMFCIDDRSCSFRRYLEREDASCETFGTPGFFGVEFYFQPDHGKFYTKLCPAPVNPKYLIKEIGVRRKREKDAHFTKHSHGLFRGALLTQTLGFWSAARLFMNIFKPSMGPTATTSLEHMEKFSKLTIESKGTGQTENNLQVGFTIDEMVVRVEGLLKSIGLVKDFSSLVYVIGHGSSSVNNPHYAAYDCGACSGRAGSVNSRVICHMANHEQVRVLLADRGLVIPPQTQFVGGLHDTTRDEIVFFDEDSLTSENRLLHQQNEDVFRRALDLNAKERSRRFESIDSTRSPEEIHERIKTRSVSLFEPRPELNHATNALCIVGRRSLTRNLFLDRRSFLNSFDYRVDPEGKYLLNILKAAAPVCGGINLEYYFSRVDNQKLGAGTKLPHNVMGLFGVANGIDGDLRPGLPSQMIEMHEPVRLLMIVEHYPAVVLRTIRQSPETYEWFKHQWIHLMVVDPDTHDFHQFSDESFKEYRPQAGKVPVREEINSVLESSDENIHVFSFS